MANEKMRRFSITLPESLYFYYLEHAEEKSRSIQSLTLYALKRLAATNPLPREIAEKKGRKIEELTQVPEGEKD